MRGEHIPKRTIKRRWPLEDRVTYTCQGCGFTVTDNGTEARRSWLRHELRTGRRVTR